MKFSGEFLYRVRVTRYPLGAFTYIPEAADLIVLPTDTAAEINDGSRQHHSGAET
jgi:hypothetical protein